MDRKIIVQNDIATNVVASGKDLLRSALTKNRPADSSETVPPETADVSPNSAGISRRSYIAMAGTATASLSAVATTSGTATAATGSTPSGESTYGLQGYGDHGYGGVE